MASRFGSRFRRRGSSNATEAAEISTETDADDSGSEEGQWLEYELHPWALESRVMLRQLLVADEVVHSWQGATLLVHHTLEDQVDTLISEVEDAQVQRIEPDDDLTAFEIGEWPPDLRQELMTRLTQSGVPHLLDEEDDACDLLVREADEEQVELVIDDILARQEEADLVELDGLEVNEQLSDLFVACDRLRRNPRDAGGVLDALSSARRVTRVRTPFGFSSQNWRALREAAGTLAALLESDDTDDDELRDLAQRLRDVLQTLI